MCWTSAYYVRCETCKEDLDSRLEVDEMCRNKRKGMTPCTYIYPVKVNVEWVDLTHCLMCTAKKDILETMEKEAKEREYKDKQLEEDAKHQEAKLASSSEPEEEKQPSGEESDDALIWKQLINDENHQMEVEKRGRMDEWLQGLAESRRGGEGSRRLKRGVLRG
ncbi:hypothetical protein FLONG3_1607 [Fusarium longipes]|uniref:Uncharacterized protein n=1 Tax=Fusarium longipes TaxID=694270 RepID=A0A395T7A3_9HYPO|nr:hypothetical protein FLONG3_1607 [Fusarium longipes]